MCGSVCARSVFDQIRVRKHVPISNWSTAHREIWCAINMGVLWWYSSTVFVRLLLGGYCICLVSCAAVRVERAAVEKSVTGVCDMPGCNCSDTAKIWKIINCTFNSSQASWPEIIGSLTTHGDSNKRCIYRFGMEMLLVSAYIFFYQRYYKEC